MFDTVPQKMSDAGTSAGDNVATAMKNGAGEAGDIIGNRFAAIASGVGVGLDLSGLPGAPGKKADPGSQTATERA